ncbi:DUF6882 domain-containing protein [Paraburkholderia sp.]|uniref:DUF6882 domain-containing protein n=1 Tax=Paraburkholderia sp. TaxID=1926495 RepID=UPI00286FAA9E|nr:DUF6882 domain-containing protein [Paraburkholderia sp.]
MHSVDNCPLCSASGKTDAMTDDEFAALQEHCESELVQKQASFIKQIGNSGSWHYDLDTSTLTVGTHRFRITAIGTHSASMDTWLWAWANDSFPDRARAAASEVQRLFQITGFRVFETPGIDASRADANVLTAMAVHVLAADGIFKALDDDRTLFLAVHEAIP